ncbi:MAG: type II secretion system GspH family protein [Candidatus Gastranaerophilales bacterium]|nr:type II secretion system GspH family protein [Candidatus Gastranaerophilales bacterium]
MQKSFTLSEALITLAIIGVLAAILIPVINNVRPDKDKVTYKKALYSMQTAVSNAMDSTLYTMAANSEAYWKDANVGQGDFCAAVASALNTSGTVNCNGPWSNCSTGSSCYDEPNFITTDGIRYWGLEDAFPDGKDSENTYTIFVDRNLSTREVQTINNKRPNGLGLQIQVRYDGKVSTPETDDFEYENELIENSLQVSAGGGG